MTTVNATTDNTEITSSYYLPQPGLRVSPGTFDKLLSTAGSVASQAIGSVGGIDLGALDNLRSLIEMQQQFQVEMQQTTMISNAERTKHETRMSAIRNMRVG